MDIYKVTILLDSLADRSYTYTIINEILFNLENNYGYKFKKNILSKDQLNIQYCKRCFKCFKSLYCPIEGSDDMKYIKSGLLDADLIIFGLPVSNLFAILVCLALNLAIAFFISFSILVAFLFFSYLEQFQLVPLFHQTSIHNHKQFCVAHYNTYI